MLRVFFKVRGELDANSLAVMDYQMIIGKETARANGHISLQLQMNERERGEIKVRHLRITFQVNFTCQLLTSTLIQSSIHFRHHLSNSYLGRVSYQGTGHSPEGGVRVEDFGR